MDKKTFLKFCLCFLTLFLLTLSPTLADEIETKQYFDVEYEVGRQSVWTGSIPLNIYITPSSDYKRVEMTFNNNTMIDVQYSGPEFFPVTKGETYHVQAKILPKEAGTHQITINAIAWEYNTNYTSSEPMKIQIDENQQIVPQTQAYKILNVLKYILIIVIVIALVAAGYFAINKNMTKIKKWFEPDY